MEIKPGELQFGKTTKSIKGKPIEGSKRLIGHYMLEEWELPCLELNSKTNCFEPTGETYIKWGATKRTVGGSDTYYFPTLAEAEIYALTHLT